MAASISRSTGARGTRTLRSVILPLALPGVVAGSIFTFSLTLGDYITPLLVGGTNSQFIGNAVYDSVGVSSNTPFAAAFATIPVLVIGGEKALGELLGQQMKLVASDVTVVVLKDTGHWVLEERPKETTDALLKFL